MTKSLWNCTPNSVSQSWPMLQRWSLKVCYFCLFKTNVMILGGCCYKVISPPSEENYCVLASPYFSRLTIAGRDYQTLFSLSSCKRSFKRNVWCESREVWYRGVGRLLRLWQLRLIVHTIFPWESVSFYKSQSSICLSEKNFSISSIKVFASSPNAHRDQ